MPVSKDFVVSDTEVFAIGKTMNWLKCDVVANVNSFCDIKKGDSEWVLVIEGPCSVEAGYHSNVEGSGMGRKEDDVSQNGVDKHIKAGAKMMECWKNDSGAWFQGISNECDEHK